MVVKSRRRRSAWSLTPFAVLLLLLTIAALAGALLFVA